MGNLEAPTQFTTLDGPPQFQSLKGLNLGIKALKDARFIFKQEIKITCASHAYIMIMILFSMYIIIMAHKKEYVI